MVKKLDDLKEFVSYYKKEGLIRITDSQLEYDIAKVFGISAFILRSTKEALSKFGFIKPAGNMGIWEIIYDGEIS